MRRARDANGLKRGEKKRNMAHKRWFGWGLALLALTGAGAVFGQGLLGEQTSMVEQSRLTGNWQVSAPVVLPASLPPLPKNATDLGIASTQTPLERMLLLLEPSKVQATALDAKLADQIDWT